MALIAAGAAVEFRDPDFCGTAFLTACGNGNADCVELLMRAGCDYDSQCTQAPFVGKKGQDIAKARGHTDVVERIMEVRSSPEQTAADDAYMQHRLANDPGMAATYIL